ncbi:MAG: nuclear transport factor 2 family protein [Myxococcales bacterium]|jgi:hypothetical protein|nr:MAG: nuclear transport factor 2 family protein [Myxococcales bacterium]
MSHIESFIAYAGEFEETLADDDWSRLLKHFCEDAVYEVDSGSFGCRLDGPTAIFKGMKKSLDGFDRKFDGRDVAIDSGPELDGDEMRVSWSVTYKKEGLEPYVLRGRSEARFRDGKIAYLADRYDASVDADALAWQQANGLELDPRYV